MGGYLFDTEAEYNTEIALMRTYLRKAMKSKEFRINTSQTDQKIVMSPKDIREYLESLTKDKQAFIERSVGAGVTSVVARRTY